MQLSIQRLQAFLKKDFRYQKLCVKAYFLMAYAKLVLRTVPFKKIVTSVGQINSETEETAEPKHTSELREIIVKMSPFTPWKSSCFIQALTAHWMLKSRGRAHTIYFGVKKGDKERLMAHAWLRCGDLIVTGFSEYQSYNIINKFAYFPS